MIKGSINTIETMSCTDGPGLRSVVFLNGCPLRCKFCHNPEMLTIKETNTTPEELVEKLLKNKTYFKNGGVTFSGGEPLIQDKFLIEVCKLLKKENIHIAIETSGNCNYNKELINLIDLIILDIKHITNKGYIDITTKPIDKLLNFIQELNKSNKDVWITQVITPNINDSKEYIEELNKFILNIDDVKKIKFLPYHKLGIEKYNSLNIPYTLDCESMDSIKCEELYKYLIKLKSDN